ncbi:hypothetical protein ACZ11_23780 [Lysinibacillus xylanilyticus]|uniref:Uncharacterized protein n=1 Tax=Lysinibacillus xylanilyticus TaxID=582475 RepID=A0A0K9F2G0_9BACI|nr:hypothetical protein [Lysinibacillus xylanilyticus]KMY28258.1 hypothetical protein ACZ11_23780 [Lysinibacillus xylanilyticus]
MGNIAGNHRLKGIIIKHHSKKVQDYYNSVTLESKKDNRSNAIKLYEIGACEFEDLPMVEATIGRIFGEFKRAGTGAYKDVEVLYQNVIEAAFAYFVDNHDHFYVRTKLAFADGIDKYELHRREQHYTSSSVFWLLHLAHDDVHKPYYVVQIHNANGGYIEREEFRNKDVLRQTYGLTKQQFEEALESGIFIFDGNVANLKIVTSAIEASFIEHLKIEQRFLASQIRFLKQAVDEDKKSSILESIISILEDIDSYTRLLGEDKAYNEKVKQLKGKSAIELWNKKAEELRASHYATKDK